ncbi:hypothetical protein HDU93_006987, partial [Gonapodya sp. JEL0774]
LYYPTPTTPLAHGIHPFFLIPRLSTTALILPLSINYTTAGSLLKDSTIRSITAACGITVPSSSETTASGDGQPEIQPDAANGNLRIWYTSRVDLSILKAVRWLGVSWAPVIQGEVVVQCPKDAVSGLGV